MKSMSLNYMHSANVMIWNLATAIIKQFLKFVWQVIKILWPRLSSLKSQKGALTIEICSVESQKGTITIYSVQRYCALLVLNATSFNIIDSVLLALNWWFPESYICQLNYSKCINLKYTSLLGLQSWYDPFMYMYEELSCKRG